MMKSNNSTLARCLLVPLCLCSIVLVYNISQEDWYTSTIFRSRIPIELMSNSGLDKTHIRKKKELYVQKDGNLTIIPRRIFMFWDSGWDDAPKMQKLCLNSFRRHNPEFEITAMNLSEAENLIDRRKHYTDEAWTSASIQAKSDIIRVELLAKYGGVWADATLYCNEPLLNWLNDNILPSKFLCYDRSSIIASWFIVSAVDSYIIQTWRNLVRDAWTRDPSPQQTLGYVWVHKLFGNLVHNDTEFREQYEIMPLLPAAGPHCTLREPTPHVYKIKARYCYDLRQKLLAEDDIN